MWNNYFYQIQSKYSMRVSKKLPLVIRLDGKCITRDKNINLLDKYNGSFLDSLEKTITYFSKKYNCYAIFGSDEVSFIITNPVLLMESLDPNEVSDHTNEIISLFSQYFFDYFNNFDKHKKVFWHGKCFTIPENKIISYIKYRSKIIQNVMSTYFLKRKNANPGNIKLNEKIEKCRQFSDYDVLKNVERGILYYDGERIDFDEFMNGNIKVVENNENKEEIYVDLFNF